jgi:hypothetical protein
VVIIECVEYALLSPLQIFLSGPTSQQLDEQPLEPSVVFMVLLLPICIQMTVLMRRDAMTASVDAARLRLFSLVE